MAVLERMRSLGRLGRPAAGVSAAFRSAGGPGGAACWTLLARTNRARQRLPAFGLPDHYQGIVSLTRLDEAIAIVDDEDAAGIAERPSTP